MKRTTHHIAIALGLGVAFALAPAAQASEGGLEILPDPMRLLMQIALFAVLIPVVSRLLWRPLLGVLEERDARIAGARERAAELAQEAEELLARHAVAVREAREATGAERKRQVEEARGVHQQSVAEARSAAETEILRTRSEVSAAVESARTTLQSEAQQLAGDIAGRLLGRVVQ